MGVAAWAGQELGWLAAAGQGAGGSDMVVSGQCCMAAAEQQQNRVAAAFAGGAAELLAEFQCKAVDAQLCALVTEQVKLLVA